MPEETVSKSAGTSARPVVFVARSLALIALTGLFYWIGWRSPWARADQSVKVQVVDPPKAAPAPAPAAQNAPEAVVQPNGVEPASDREERPARRTRRHRQRSADDTEAPSRHSRQVHPSEDASPD